MKLIFDANNLCTDICKTIFVILEVQFHHEGGLSKTRYFELFFSAWSIFSPNKNSALTEAPFNLFWTLTMILAIFAFWKSHEIFLVQNLGHKSSQKVQNCQIWEFLDWETTVYFWTFFGRLKTLLNPLTYSAMPWEVLNCKGKEN